MVLATLWSFVQDYHMWLVEIRQMSLLIDILDSFYLSLGVMVCSFITRWSLIFILSVSE